MNEDIKGSTSIAVLGCHLGARYSEAIPLKLIAGVGFIAIGVWILVEHFRGEIMILEDLLDRDLSHWVAPDPQLADPLL